MCRFSRLSAGIVAASLMASSAAFAQSAGSGGAGPAPGVATQAPGANAAGTADSSAPLVTGVRAPRAKPEAYKDDPAISAEDRALDRKLRSICRGC